MQQPVFWTVCVGLSARTLVDVAVVHCNPVLWTSSPTVVGTTAGEAKHGETAGGGKRRITLPSWETWNDLPIGQTGDPLSWHDTSVGRSLCCCDLAVFLIFFHVSLRRLRMQLCEFLTFSVLACCCLTGTLAGLPAALTQSRKEWPFYFNPQYRQVRTSSVCQKAAGLRLRIVPSAHKYNLCVPASSVHVLSCRTLT